LFMVMVGWGASVVIVGIVLYPLILDLAITDITQGYLARGEQGEAHLYREFVILAFGVGVGAIGGAVSSLALSRIRPPVRPSGLLWMTVAWSVGSAVGWAVLYMLVDLHYMLVDLHALDWTDYRNWPVFAARASVRGATQGLIGGGVMFWLLARRRA